MIEIPRNLNINIKYLRDNMGKKNHPLFKNYNLSDIIVGGIVNGEPVILKVGADINDAGFMRFMPMVHRNANVNKGRPKWVNSGFDLVSWTLEDPNNTLYVFSNQEEYNNWLDAL